MLLGVGSWIFWPTNPIHYIQKTTGILFPKEAFDIDVYDNGEHQQLPRDADVYSLGGRAVHNRWEVLLDRNSGRLLVSVLYSAFAGNDP